MEKKPLIKMRSENARGCPACDAGIHITIIGSGDMPLLTHEQLVEAAAQLHIPLTDLVQAYKEAYPHAILSSPPSESLIQKLPEPEEIEPYVPKRSPHSYQSVKERNRFFNRRGRK